MGEYSEAFVAFDTAKVKHAVAIADGIVEEITTAIRRATAKRCE